MRAHLEIVRPCARATTEGLNGAYTHAHICAHGTRTERAKHKGWFSHCQESDKCKMCPVFTLFLTAAPAPVAQPADVLLPSPLLFFPSSAVMSSNFRSSHYCAVLSKGAGVMTRGKNVGVFVENRELRRRATRRPHSSSSPPRRLTSYVRLPMFSLSL